MDVTWYCCGVLVVGVLLYYINTRRRYYRLARRIPGPRPWPLVGNALQLLPYSESIIHKFTEILDQYDGLAAVWMGEKLTVLISKPEHLEIFFNSTKLLDRSEHYDFIRAILPNGLFTADGETWKKNRRMYATSFHPTILNTFVPVFQRQSLILVDVIRKEVGQPEFEVFNYIKNCTQDFILETAMSYDLQSQTKYIATLKDVCQLMKIIYHRAFKIYQHPYMLFKFLQDGITHDKAIKDIQQFGNEIVVAKKKDYDQLSYTAGSEEDTRMKNLFINQMFKHGGITDEELRDHILTMSVTGYDTTGGTLGFTLMMLGIHQEVQEKVYQEVALLQEHLFGRDLEPQDLNSLEYMERVIKETLRLFPVGPVFFRKAMDDIKFGDHVVPRGAAVGCVLLRTHRDPTIFPDPLKFNPDNFLPENMVGRHPYAYAPFSAGPRGCIGMRYAWMSMKTILLNLLWNYRILCDRRMEDMVVKAEITLKVEGGFKIRLEDRRQ